MDEYVKKDTAIVNIRPRTNAKAIQTDYRGNKRMSILIKGMEMPPTCRYCAFRHLSISGNAFCTAANETIDYMAERTKRLDNCPLIELPPHGDLIDRDAVLKMVQKAKEDDTALADVYQEDYIAVRDWLAVATVVVESEDGDG